MKKGLKLGIFALTFLSAGILTLGAAKSAYTNGKVANALDEFRVYGVWDVGYAQMVSQTSEGGAIEYEVKNGDFNFLFGSDKKLTDRYEKASFVRYAVYAPWENWYSMTMVTEHTSNAWNSYFSNFTMNRSDMFAGRRGDWNQNGREVTFNIALNQGWNYVYVNLHNTKGMVGVKFGGISDIKLDKVQDTEDTKYAVNTIGDLTRYYWGDDKAGLKDATFTPEYKVVSSTSKPTFDLDMSSDKDVYANVLNNSGETKTMKVEVGGAETTVDIPSSNEIQAIKIAETAISKVTLSTEQNDEKLLIKSVNTGEAQGGEGQGGEEGGEEQGGQEEPAEPTALPYFAEAESLNLQGGASIGSSGANWSNGQYVAFSGEGSIEIPFVAGKDSKFAITFGMSASNSDVRVKLDGKSQTPYSQVNTPSWHPDAVKSISYTATIKMDITKGTHIISFHNPTNGGWINYDFFEITYESVDTYYKNFMSITHTECAKGVNFDASKWLELETSYQGIAVDERGLLNGYEDMLARYQAVLTAHPTFTNFLVDDEGRPVVESYAGYMPISEISCEAALIAGIASLIALAGIGLYRGRKYEK